jgi:rhodanese-related sulfurtransferase
MKYKKIAAKELNEQIQSGFLSKSAIVDLRTHTEYEDGHIQNAIHTILHTFTGNEAFLKVAEKIFIICRNSNHSIKAFEKLPQNVKERVYILDGGMKAWEMNGFLIQKTVKQGRFSVTQQTQITMGVMIIIFSILALTVNKFFAVLTLFVGINLTTEGMSNVCMLLEFISKMPWNKK